jgi:DNA-binding FadR family transcriptional regulator
MGGKMFSGNFTRHIVDSLGKAIATGIHPAGKPLKAESELCQDFDASRTVLREAVKMLTAKGMF